MTSAVIRRWEASVDRADIDNWVETFRARVLPGMRAVKGFCGVSFLAKRDDDPCHVVVLTKWQDMASVTRFAGENAAKTVLPDFMARFFRTYDAEATFYDEVLREEANE